MTAHHNWREWENGHVPRQPEPVFTCEICGGAAGDWQIIDERRQTVACPECAAKAEDDDADADYGDWLYHNRRD